jgi:hypothetical protein
VKSRPRSKPSAPDADCIAERVAAILLSKMSAEESKNKGKQSEPAKEKPRPKAKAKAAEVQAPAPPTKSFGWC